MPVEVVLQHVHERLPAKTKVNSLLCHAAISQINHFMFNSLFYCMCSTIWIICSDDYERTHFIILKNTLFKRAVWEFQFYKIKHKLYFRIFKSFQYFLTSPSPALECNWLYRQWPTNRSDYTSAWVEELKISCSDMKARDVLQKIGEKRQYFLNTL